MANPGQWERYSLMKTRLQKGIPFLHRSIVTITISRQNEMPQTLYVYDALGKLMNTIQVTGQEQQVDVSELPNGIYIVRCENRIVKLVMRR